MQKKKIKEVREEDEVERARGYEGEGDERSEL